MKRESGESPERSRHCKEGGSFKLYHCFYGTGRCKEPMKSSQETCHKGAHRIPTGDRRVLQMIWSRNKKASTRRVHNFREQWAALYESGFD
jgi:hypothetical protein